jgi:hypothetical protein
MPTSETIDLISSSDDEEKARISGSKKKRNGIHGPKDNNTTRNQRLKTVDKIQESGTEITDSITSYCCFATANSQKQSNRDTYDSLEYFIGKLDPKDNGTLSRVKLPFSTTETEVLTCSRCPPILPCSCDQRTSTKTVHTVHIQQHDKWSCGFRNAQIMLYSVLADIPSGHILLRNAATRKTIPSVEQLQTFMEHAWAEGFDPTGCRHFKGKIVGKQSKVGAMEIASVLSFLRLDCAVVQFIVCEESRSLLGPFVWEYFQRRNGCQACQICRTEPSACLSLARDLLEWTGKDENYANETCHHPVQPLYLQWEGHSVTIVGIERCGNAYNLIVFDPLSRWVSTEEHDLNWFQKLRLSTQTTNRKDCQIVICSCMHLDDTEWQRRKANESCHVITAASEIVQKKIGSTMKA